MGAIAFCVVWPDRQRRGALRVLGSVQLVHNEHPSVPNLLPSLVVAYVMTFVDGCMGDYIATHTELQIFVETKIN